MNSYGAFNFLSRYEIHRKKCLRNEHGDIRDRDILVCIENFVVKSETSESKKIEARVQYLVNALKLQHEGTAEETGQSDAWVDGYSLAIGCIENILRSRARRRSLESELVVDGPPWEPRDRDEYIWSRLLLAPRKKRKKGRGGSIQSVLPFPVFTLYFISGLFSGA